MSDNKKRYWKGLEQLQNKEGFVRANEHEFPEYLPINSNHGEGGPSRRDFLKMMGFGIAAVSLAACEAPVKYAIPYLNKPADVDPTIPNFYASTYAHGGDYCSIVVKTREGRPIKIEGNQYSKISQGGTDAQVQASVLSLYDHTRLQGPVAVKEGGDVEKVSWEVLDKTTIGRLRQARNLRIVSNTVLSPSTKAVIGDLISTYGGEHIMYDPASSFALIEAHRENFGQAAVPSYDFTQAEVIVGFNADFLGTWLSTVENNKQYSKTRKVSEVNKTMSRHYQFESLMTITGANADYRTPIRPSEEGMAIAALYNLIAGGNATSVNTGRQAGEIKNLQKAANDLIKARGRSLVVSGSNDIAVQRMVNAINQALGNYGTTIQINNPAYYKQGDDRRMARFVQDAANGQVDAVIFYDCNPVYDYAGGATLANALSSNKVQFAVSTSYKLDETAVLCNLVAPDHHYLESWNDYEPKQGQYSLAQPTIRPIFETRQAQESFLLWTSGTATPYFDYLRNRWRSSQFAQQSEIVDFQTFWDTVLFTGVYVPGDGLNIMITPGGADEVIEGGPSKAMTTPDSVATNAAAVNRTTINTPIVGTATAVEPVQQLNYTGNADADARAIAGTYKTNPANVELVIYQKIGIGTGRQANNPWLQELPDPITKVTWDNYLTIPISLANEWGMENELGQGKTKFANLKIGNAEPVKVPVLIQPGQANGTVGISLGYGRKVAGLVGDNVGVNAYPFLRIDNTGVVHYNQLESVSVELVNDNYYLAQTQTHQTFMGRETVIQDSTLAEYQADSKAGRFEPKIATSHGPMDPNAVSLWDGHVYPNHHWTMVIDMNSCTGCSACTIACNVENNIPVVGKAEVLNRRDMLWLRIDRYYSSDSVDNLREMEQASENPEVTFQPMLCQHCNNAPCETVCPVVATTHSTEGLNQMAYNRCIGTRYCANNCPYKVRRFNWFKYHDNEEFAFNTPMSTDLGKMVLNPDVTVRARGVMEKCTFCVQRIQAGKLNAKREGRRPLDGEIVTACASACPTDAITFGDINDPDSRVRELLEMEKEGRAYNVLKEIGTRPNVYYLTKIRNKDLEQTTA
ncbi:Fe-S-cluster-containing hydrogenase subunit [Flammeovirgaceae bacterium 311]|nr:Fe-S-cluster-containing hydrogenase subunit [Flammeovirgaceae bacterium 311]